MTKTSKINIPQLGLGTYQIIGKECQNIVEQAYDLGYRHFDTASFYENEEYIGAALKKKQREDYFITTKVWPDDMGYHEALKAFERSINKLQTTYLDLYLIHWPHPKDKIFKTLEALNDLKSKNKIKYYGVSNFTAHHIEDCKREGFDISANQVEYHPYLNQQELLKYCHENEIELIAYSPLVVGKILNDPLITKIGLKYQKNVAQTVLKWLLQKGIIVIPKTRSVSRLKENLDIFDFQLSHAEMEAINKLNRNYRSCRWDEGEDFDY